MEFSVRSMKMMIQENTEKRVSEDSATELGEFLEEWSKDVSQEAGEIAKEKGRKTIRAEDIREALSNRKKRDVEENLDL